MANWENVGKIQGEKGEQGPQGERGLKGDKGDKGEQGEPGIDGLFQTDNSKTTETPISEYPQGVSYMYLASRATHDFPEIYSFVMTFRQGTTGFQINFGASANLSANSIKMRRTSNDGWHDFVSLPYIGSNGTVSINLQNLEDRIAALEGGA